MNRILTLYEDEIRQALDDTTIAAIVLAVDPEHVAHSLREGIVEALLRFAKEDATV